MSHGPTKRLRIRGGRRPLSGTIDVPGEKSIGHRAILFAALARGTSEIRGLSGGDDNRATQGIFEAMGVRFEELASEERGQALRVHGVGLHGLRMPQTNLDCGNSGTTMRLLSGLLAGQRFGSRLIGDASLTRRPMGRVVHPLRARGAVISGMNADGTRRAGDEEECYPPLSIAPLVGDERLAGIEYDMPIASAQVKSSMLLAGLYAAEPTIVDEPVLSRDHTERMLLALGAPLRSQGTVVALDVTAEGWDDPAARGWDAFSWRVPGDPSSAAFPLAAAALLPGSEITLRGVGVNPTRTGFLDALRLFGLGFTAVPKEDGAGGEPVSDLYVERSSRARGGMIGGELLVRMIDEVPAFCVVAAGARGTTEIRDAAELRVKESDRLAAMAQVLSAFGVPNQELDDGLIIEGGGALHAARVESRGDHRIAMSAALLALAAEGESVIEDVACVDTSYPGFAADLRALGADVIEESE